MERARARSLIEQLELSGVDFLAGIPAPLVERLVQHETDARNRLAGLESKLGELRDRTELSATERRKQAEPIEADLATARQDCLDAYRDVRNASPACRVVVGKNRQPIALAALQESLGKTGSLLLEYLAGDEGCYVLVVPPAGATAHLVKLVLDEGQARILGVETGPLTAARLQTILLGGPARGGVLTRLTSSNHDERTDHELAALWHVLFPETERKAILEGKFKHLVIAPDGPLALLPFEALVVEETLEPKYLLDAGPPIAYAPSATIFSNLTERPAASPAADREPVLAIGDPAYGEAGATDPVPTTALAALTSRSRYSGVGGRLSRLPFSGAEVRSVVKDYSEAGINTASLSGATATERGVRYWSAGRKVLHLACHGLTDQQHGNFFGALALTPGPKGSENPADDGFLTLPEIYALNLRGCELSILSACQTNYGPQQKGEGTWALSRGFLVAGSRRVVASNWLVDDEAAANLVHYFCAGLARAEKDGKPVDHAAALQAAKRWVRQQEKWKSPYYWASMVLMGPP